MEYSEDNKQQGDISADLTNMEQKFDAEKSPSDSTTTAQAEKQQEYITGWKLFVVIAAVTLVAFLMLLDMSIIVTVSTLSRICQLYCY
jgi:hypothetical protein